MRLLMAFGATGVAAGATALKAAKTSICFNELNEKINEKIRTPNAPP
jgi:hypothetical protein